MFAAAERIALSAPDAVQVELLAAHPRIGAPPVTVSSLSYREQGYDREQQEAIAALGPLNDAYEARFGFRYVIFVAGRPRSAIVPLLEAGARSGIATRNDDVVSGTWWPSPGHARPAWAWCRRM